MSDRVLATTLKHYSLLAAMALLFGVVNLGMYSFLPLEFISKYSEFETELPPFLIILVIFCFAFILACGFSVIFHRHERVSTDKASKRRSFFKGSVPGFIGSNFLGIPCLRGFDQTDIRNVDESFIAFLILVVGPSMILGGIARIMLPERRFVPVLIPVMIFVGGMSSYLSLKVFIRSFFG